MSGIYGDMLLHFMEQMETLSAYRMTPQQGGGWTAVPDSTVTFRGIIQNTGGSRIKDGNGNLVKSDGMEVWTAQTGLSGAFLSYNGIIYRMGISDNDWTRQGGFIRYNLEKVVGNNGTESDNTAWNTGYNSFS